MTPQTLKTWFPRWVKEWLFPKASQALAVSAVSAVIFAIDEKTWYYGLARERFDAILGKVNGLVPLCLAIALAVVFVLSFSARAIRKGRGLRFLAFERISSTVGAALNALWGLLLVPLVIAGTWAFYGNASDSASLKWPVMMYAGSFLITGAAFHWLSGQDLNPPQYITYTVSIPSNMSSEAANAVTQNRLDAVLSHVALVESPIVLVHAKNNDLTIVIPFKTAFVYWPIAQQVALFKYLAAIEIEWRDENWPFTKTVPKEY